MTTGTGVLLKVLLHLKLHMLSLKRRVADGLVVVGVDSQTIASRLGLADSFDLDGAGVAHEGAELVMDVWLRKEVSLALLSYAFQHAIDLAFLVHGLLNVGSRGLANQA